MNFSNLHIGNSICGNSAIDDLKSQIDLIVSNPPFGAEFELHELKQENYPFITSLNGKYKKIKSEIAILDKSLNLLKDYGYLAIVVPDSIISSSGIYSDLRDYLLENFAIRYVLDLPSVTFAQAGTRTNTAILIIQKKKVSHQTIFMATCENIGYEVKERVGVPVKILKGENELERIKHSIFNKSYGDKSIVSKVKFDNRQSNILKPSFFHHTIISNNCGIKTRKLLDFVEVTTTNRKSFMASSEIKHISVLHVDDDGIIEFSNVEKFQPISKGREVFFGDILFSKINPRISRVCIVPKSNYRLVCSNEFEILRVKNPNHLELLCYILKTQFVKSQIEKLTSGTSSSHNRIKREQLLSVQIPDLNILYNNTQISAKLVDLDVSIKNIYYAKKSIGELLQLIETLHQNPHHLV